MRLPPAVAVIGERRIVRRDGRQHVNPQGAGAAGTGRGSMTRAPDRDRHHRHAAANRGDECALRGIGRPGLLAECALGEEAQRFAALGGLDDLPRVAGAAAQLVTLDELEPTRRSRKCATGMFAFRP